MGKTAQTRRRLAAFANWRVSVTLKDARVLVGTLMAVDKHVNLVLHNCEEYRRYKVRSKPDGKELKRLLGFVVVRGEEIVYVNPEELGKDELVEPAKPRKVKASAAKAAPATGATMPGLPGLPKAGGLNPAMLQGLLRGPTPGGLAGLPGLPGLPGMPKLGGLPGLGTMPGMPGMLPGMPGGIPNLAALLGKAPMLNLPRG
mmetsp:Transcript_42154/g.67280  ORF Transcript_42154/g.67280 Transcript_42154/m.67280 type:complete len:201 (-) Transcript_42154:130-732(-)